MEENTVKEIIAALKRLIKELKDGYCDGLSSNQIDRLERGFSEILEVEKEVNKNGLYTDSNNDRSLSWRNIFRHVLPFKKERDKG